MDDALLVLDCCTEQALADVRPAHVDAQREHSRDQKRPHAAAQHEEGQLVRGVKRLVRDGSANEGKNEGVD